MASIRIGISGWSYKDWGGSFYPDDLPREDELGYAAERFDTLEINGTFYDAGSRILLVTSRAVRLLLEVDYPEPCTPVGLNPSKRQWTHSMPGRDYRLPWLDRKAQDRR